jgi:hypothetical protein
MSIDDAKSLYVASSYVAIETDHSSDASPVSAARVRNICQSLVIVLGAASLAACAQSTAVRNSEFAGPSRHASLTHGITLHQLHQHARRVREKAYAVRAAQQWGPDTGRLAGSCQLLHGGATDRERRKVRYERFDRRSSHVAVWHPVAGDKRRYGAVGDGAGQRSRSLRSRTCCRCFAFRGQRARDGSKRDRKGQTRRRSIIGGSGGDAISDRAVHSLMSRERPHIPRCRCGKAGPWR